MRLSCSCLSLVALGLLAGLHPSRAERFLSMEEARVACYAAADRYEPRTVRFTPAQAKAVAAASGLPVKNAGNRAWLAWQGTNLLGVMVLDHVLGKHELIDYAVAITPSGSVERVEILEYRESHGGEIRGERWRGQFKGKTGREPLRLNEDIHNISGATISCRHVTEGVRRVLATFDLLIRPGLPPAPAGTAAGAASSPGPRAASAGPAGDVSRVSVGRAGGR